MKKMDSSKLYSDDKNSLKKIKEKKRRKIESHLKEWMNLYPDFLLSLNKPKQLISNTFKDAGGNLRIGYRNAGYQVISENVMAYKYANRNPLADATKGMDIIAMQTVGNHILAGTTLRLFVYEAKKGEPKYYYYENNSSINNIVPLDNDRVWLVANNQIKSCRLLPGNQLSTTGTFRSSAVLGCGTRQANDVYASCQAPYVIKYPFGTDHAERIAYRNTWYDAETQLTTLQDGSILLFMKNMHLALLSPATEKITDLEVKGAPKHGNIDPAFARQDSRGNIWLGTKRAGLYRFNLKDRKLEKMDFVNDVHVQGLLEDDRHQIWITTLKNAICYQPSTGAVLMNSLVSSSQNEWNRQYFDNSLCISPTGNLVFGSSDGCIFLPQEAGDKTLMANKKFIANKKALRNQKQSGNHHLEIYDQSKALEKGLRIYSLDIKTKDGETLAMNDDIHDGDSYTLAYDEKTLNRVCLSVNRMLKLIDQMLDFNQLETDALRLKVAQVDARKELQQLIASFEESTRVKGIKLETRFEDDNYEVWLDNDKLEQVMDNLFTNALKHTNNQGIIRITASCRDGKLQISIFNSGEPIEENRLKDVFKRYYQLSVTEGNHHYGWGTGIGLYYVKRLIGLHHGEITVRNQPSGVEFSFWMPTDKSIYAPSEQVKEKTEVMQIPLDDTYEITTEEAEEKASADSTDESSETTQKPKILVVDDDIDVAQYITSLLSHDYIVVNRYSAEEALEDLEQVKPDLILSDIIMGKMSGYDFCVTIKQNLLFSHIPVILITAKSNMNEQITGLRLGAVAYITKPFDPLYLKAMVQTQLHNMAILRKGLVDSTDTETLDAPVANTLSDQDRKFMDELYALMEKRSAEMELNVTTVCHDLLISQSKFAYKLKELTGETPGSFFRSYKLNKAARMVMRSGCLRRSRSAI